ncbi:MAG: hypothetical protein OXH98_09370 [Caldilineaceae bacterium]|nr:hypothetical protein [Caldilineaceae bacterium]
MLNAPKTAQNGRGATTTACEVSGSMITNSLKTGKKVPMTKLPPYLIPFLPLN